MLIAAVRAGLGWETFGQIENLASDPPTSWLAARRFLRAFEN
jgi:hypothetical protein